MLPRCTNSAILFDSNNFHGLDTGAWEGMLTVQSMDQGPSSSVGVTISNDSFVGGGNADGIQVLGDADGVQIGPGNEFSGLVESGNHEDPIQLYGAANTVITGNYFHGNGDGSGGIMSTGGDDGTIVTNNVFVLGAGASGLVDTAGADNWVIAHNTFASDANSSNGISDIRLQSYNGDTPSNDVIRDNVLQHGLSNECGCTWGTENHNLGGGLNGTGDLNGKPVYLGGSAYGAWRLAAGSPGKGAASDGTDIGIP